jgi:hypothetical protein
VAEVRLRWVGALLLLFAVTAGAYLIMRYYGLRVGWWPTLLPFKEANVALHFVVSSTHSLFSRILAW